MKFTDKINVLSALAAGIFAGGTLMIGVTFGLQWGDLSPEELIKAFPHDWKNIATTIIPFALLQTFLIPLSLYFAWQNKPARKLWIITLGLWFANCTITSVYHFPVVLQGLNGEIDVTQIKDVVDQWLLYHWPRVLLGIAATIYAVCACIITYKESK
jgi:hypothetical protein